MVSRKTQLIERTNPGKIALALARQWQKNGSQQGLTLMECLVAIAVIGVVAGAFTPPIFLAVATREQNRRAEQALQLAQAEIDRVRRVVEQGQYSNNQLPPVGDSNVREQSRPGGFTTTPTGVSATNGLLVDVNGDGTNDFLVQTFRNAGTPDQNGKIVAFDMGVRVYIAKVTDNFGTLDSPPKRSASLQLTTALGQQRRLPLAAMYTSVVRSDNANSLCSYRRFQNPGDNVACN